MNIIYLEETDSTQNYIKQHPELAPPYGVLAGRQTAGRGRLGRSFHSPEGLGMYLSVCLEANPRLTATLTPAAAVAGRWAIAQLGLDCGVKWVNDLVVQREGRLRKLCGILAELCGDRLVLGVGIDLNQQESDFPPELREICTSVAMEGGQPATPREMAELFIAQLERAIALEPSALYEEYAAACVTVGREVVVKRTPSEEGVPARCLALHPDFSLEVAYPDGSRERLISGEASVKLG